MRNIIIVIIIAIAVGGIAFVKMGVLDREPSLPDNEETETSTGAEETPTDDEDLPELEDSTVEQVEEDDPNLPPEEEEEETPPPVEEETAWTPEPEWWKERQTPMFSNLATVMVTGAPYPTGEYTKERYLEIIDQMDASVMSWFDYMWKPIYNDEWPEYIDLMHERGLYVVGCDSMITTWKMGPDPPEHDASVCLDPYGNKWTSNYGLSGTIGEESVWYVHTLIHPDWQEYLLEGIKRNIDAGVDGYLVDELCYSAVLEPDFSEYTMTQFKLYLDEALTENEKNTYKSQFGLASWDDLDYAKEVRNALPAAWTELTYDDWRNWDIQQSIPLYEHYQRFLRIKNREAAEYIITEAKQYAEDQGKEMPFTINVNDLSSPESLIITDLVDFLDMECTFNKFESFYPKTRATAPVKLALGLGLRPSVLTSMETRSMILEKGKEETRTLYKLMIADVTAAGGCMYLEEGGHGLQVDLDALKPYYRMPTTYPELFQIDSNTNTVCVLHLWENLDAYQSKAYYGTCSLLADAGYQYDVVFGAEEYDIWGEVNKYPAPEYPLNLDQITGYNLVIIPELTDTTPTHAQIMIDYVNQGGTLLVFTSTSNINTIQNQRGMNPTINSLLGYLREEDATIGSGRCITIDQVKGTQYIDTPDHPILLDFIGMVEQTGITSPITGMTEGTISKTMYSTTSEIVVHIVNNRYDWMQDTVKPVQDKTLNIKIPTSMTDEPLTVTYYTPETTPEIIEHQLEGDTLTVTLPDLEVWGVIHITVS